MVKFYYVFYCKTKGYIVIMFFMRSFIKKYITESNSVKEEILASEHIVERIEKAVSIIFEAYKNDNKVLVAGNGGSAADAQHIVAELVSKFFIERE